MDGIHKADFLFNPSQVSDHTPRQLIPYCATSGAQETPVLSTVTYTSAYRARPREALGACSISRLYIRGTSKMVTNRELNDRREPGCSVVLADKKYFHVGGWFMKRTLRQHEWQSVSDKEVIVPPTTYPQRWKTDAAILRFLRKETDIPLPPAECTFEDDGAFYFQSQFVGGVSMKQLEQNEKEVVMKELEQHVATLQALRSDFPQVPGESLLCPPQRVTTNQWKINSCWRPMQKKGEYVFCHNDLGQHNVIVDPQTLKIQAIIDWEFAGFWPLWFEKPFWKRPGPSIALEGEEDDVQRCRDWLMSHCDEVEMPLGGKEPRLGQ